MKDKTENCKHEFVWSDIHNNYVCKHCLYELTKEDKTNILDYANQMRYIYELEEMSNDKR